MIDGGPSNLSRQISRQFAQREEASPGDKPVSTKVVDRKPIRSAEPTESQAVKTTSGWLSRFLAGVVVIILVVLAGFGGWFIGSRGGNVSVPIDASRYQAVFMNGGQVYFGKLEQSNSDYLKLSHVFYIQSSSNEAGSKADGSAINNDNDMKLIKLGGEVHGPEDVMIINRDQVLFVENLKPDGKVAQLIEKYSQGGK